MGSEIGYASLAIIPSFSGFQGKLEQGSGKHLVAAGRSGGEKFSQGMRTSVASRAKSIFAPLLAAGAAYKAGQFFMDSIHEASDLNETMNLTRVIFGKNTKTMLQWSKNSDKAFGLSQNAALQAAGQFGDMFGQIGFGEKQSVKMSKRVVKLAADLGSFKNLETGDVLERISAGFRGEYDSLQLLIPNISAARVQKEALAETGKKNADALTAEEKAAATLAIVQHDGAKAQNDFAETSKGAANSQKILQAELENSKAKIGKGLLPVYSDFLHFVSDKGVPMLDKFGTWFSNKGVPAMQDFATEAQPVVKSILPAIGDALTTAKDAAAFIAPKLKGVFDGFNKLPDWVKTTILVGAGSAALGKKLGVGSLLGSKKGGLGGGSGLLGLVSKAKPIPVFVVNGGVGGGLPGVAGKAGTAAKIEKYGKWGGLLSVPGLVAAGTGLALAKGHPLSGMPPITGMAAKAITGFVEKRKIDDATTSVLRQNDAWSKVRNNLENGTTKAHILSGEIMGTRREVEKLTGPRHVVKIEAPNLLNLLDNTRRYGSMLDGLDGRVVRTFITNIVRHQSGTGGTTDSGETLGKHSPTAQRSSTSGVNVNIGTVVAHDYNDFMYQTQQRLRRSALDGIRG